MSKKIDFFLKIAKDRNASDLHFTVGSPPIIRVNGELSSLDYPPITNEIASSVLFELLNEDQLDRFERQRDMDFAYMAKGIARFRVTIFYKENGVGGVFRLIPDVIKSLEQLNLPHMLETFAHLDKGLVLVTGATGSGKTTTLASIIDIINRSERKHIVTIEDPIEFVHRSKECQITQREVGIETESFHTALRAASRQDTDIILVGEMRDLETVSMTLSAAETGLLVFATVHTINAVKTIDRVIDVFPEEEQNHVRYILAQTLRGILSQQLLPATGGIGRVPAVEIMIGTPAICNVVREGKTHQLTSLIQAGRREGMQTMDQSIVELCRRGLITQDIAYHRIQDKSLLGRATA
ncbi:type IV pilus twitching motility protein PilT [bacterium]|nr:type IV pilus twitching motility protein PilT [candidate division CSSED10-310 bacterium]